MVIDSRPSPNDFARKWQVETSIDGQKWHPVTSGEGQPLLQIELNKTLAKYLKITQTGSAHNYWSIHDLTITKTPMNRLVVKLPRSPDWKVVAEPNNKEASNAIDGNIETRYSTLKQMQPDMWYQIELPEAVEVAGLYLNHGESADDYPRGYRVELSVDGKDWSTAAIGSGKPGQTFIFFEKQPARFLKIIQIEAETGRYWSIHELDLLTETDPQLISFIQTPKKIYLPENFPVEKLSSDNQALLKPYQGPVKREINTSTLVGKVMCGYQGWFNCKDDGMNLGWTHWKGKVRDALPGPGNVSVDLV